MNPTERFAIPRNRYVERPPDLEYRPTATTLAQAVMRELDAAPWAEGAARGALSLAVDGEKTVEALEEENLGRHGWTAICSDRQSTLSAELIAEGQRQNQQRRHEQSRRSARERERTDRPEPQERPSTRNRGERER